MADDRQSTIALIGARKPESKNRREREARRMDDAKRLAAALNILIKAPQFSNSKARAAARQESAVNWPATKGLNEDFNPDVDGFESFEMNDGSVCAWIPGQFKYAAKPGKT